ncbi:Ankyrin repeat domain-containing protein 50 [Colletotrichum fructicola]|nr:Ankyrin repeat domain-containing protein 50 [Colletotrichum fructicola]
MYTIGWIVALDNELTAALAMLDETHEQPEDFEQNNKDSNTYSWGQIGDHKIVIASLGAGSYGLVSAATTATCMATSLPHLQIGLMVGIGAGVPSFENDVRLGDVVVSQPRDGHSGVVQYDLGKMRENGHFQRVGALAPPPDVLLKVLNKLKAEQRLKGSKLPQILSQAIQKYPTLAKPKGKDPAFVYQGSENDRLFESTTLHISGERSSRNLSGGTKRRKIGDSKSCAHCDAEGEIERENRPSEDPEIHYGTIASGNLVIKDGAFRDQMTQQLGSDVLCYEMEAAALMNNFPCLVIRGICDYADTHKNDRWQNYAAIVAAAYTRELLEAIEVNGVEKAERIREVMASVSRGVSRIESRTKDTQKAVQSITDQKLLEEIVTWLGAPNPSGNQRDAFEQRHIGTGKWLLESEEEVDKDIRRFIDTTTTVSGWNALRDWTDYEDVQDEIRDHLTMNAHGMFRWVTCQLYALEPLLGTRDHDALRKTLKSLPATLDETYARIIRNTPEALREKAQRVLYFLLYSEAPLLAEEASEITKMDVNAVIVNAEGGHYGNALQAAAFQGYANIVSHLLKGGANVDAQGGQYKTALAAAVEASHEDVTKILLNWDANVNNGQDILLTAVLNRKTSIVGLLIGKSANVSREAFKWACQIGNLTTIHLLLKNIQSTDTINYCSKRLHDACKRGYYDVVQTLIRSKANVNARDWHGLSALYYAASHNHVKIVKLLLENGASFNQEDEEFEKDPFYASCTNRAMETMSILLMKDPDPLFFDEALESASYSADIEVLELLLKTAKREQQNQTNPVVLAQAMYNAILSLHEGCDTVLRLLLQHGADVDAIAGDAGKNTTMLCCAALWLQDDERKAKAMVVIEVLLEHHANVNKGHTFLGTPLNMAMRAKNYKLVNILLAKGAKWTPYFGMCMQHTAYRRKLEEVK